MCTKYSHNKKSDVDEVCDNRRPHKAKEIENLSFHNHQLHKNENRKHIVSERWTVLSVYYFKEFLTLSSCVF